VYVWHIRVGAGSRVVASTAFVDVVKRLISASAITFTFTFVSSGASAIVAAA
jgi:hypothetical protein